VKVDVFPDYRSFNPTGSWTAWQTMTTSTWLRPGVARVRISATGQSGPNLDSLTVRPTPPPPAGPQVFQAESARVINGTAFSRSQPGYTGFGYVDFPKPNFDLIQFPVSVPARGVYRVDLRYANGGSTVRDLVMNVDPGGEAQRVLFPPTGSGSTWRTVSLETVLEPGNFISFGPSNGRGPSLDSITVTPTGGMTHAIQAEAGFGVLPRSTASPGYTGTGYVDFTDRINDRISWSIAPPAAGEYDLEIRYANGSGASRPLLMWQGHSPPEDVQYVQFAPTGSWSAWRTQTVHVTLGETAVPIELQALGYAGPNVDSITIRPAPRPTDDDPDDTLAQAAFTPIGGGMGVVEGLRVPVRLDTPTDVDMARFEARAGQRVAFRQTRFANLRLRLFDAAGRELAAATTTAQDDRLPDYDLALAYTFPRTGTYYLGVSATANTSYDPVTGAGDQPGEPGTYGIAFYDRGQSPPAPAGPDPDDQFSEARVMARVGEQTIDDALSSRTDVDLYKFISPPRNGAVLKVLNQDASATDLLVRVFDVNGREIGRLKGDVLNVPVDFIDSSGMGRFRSANDVFPLFGDYYVGISAAGNGSYNPRTGANDTAGATARYRLEWVLQVPDDGPGSGDG
jgi:hypothetical protein